MKENIDNFICKFKEVSKKGWIPTTFDGFIGIGTTFENEIGKKSDSMFFP